MSFQGPWHSESRTEVGKGDDRRDVSDDSSCFSDTGDIDAYLSADDGSRTTFSVHNAYKQPKQGAFCKEGMLCKMR